MSSSIPIKILIVDDLPENLLALQAALSDLEYELIEAGSGKEALSLAEQHDFAAILMDVQMPRMDGFEAARRLRRQERNSATPIVFVTAISREDRHEQLGYIVGAVDFLFKPINTDILKSKVSVFADLFRKNQLLKEAAVREQENKDLREAVQARDEFLAMVSHELKTPITPLNLQLQTFIKLFKEGRLESVPRDKLLRLLETSEDQVDRLSKLINDLVEMSRLKSGKLELKTEQVDLGALVRGVVASFAPTGEDDSQSLIQVECDPGVVGEWDPFRLEQVVMNIVSNAVKYGAGKPIKVSVRSEGSVATLAVKDHGIGVPLSEQTRIFERFERAVSSRNYGGLGLGLFIADRLTKLHHGKISLDSLPGMGAKFTVELPKMSAIQHHGSL